MANPLGYGRAAVMKVAPPSAGDDAKPIWSVIGLLLSVVIGGVLFVVLWAGANFAFGTALDGPIGAYIMEPSCQRYARTSEPLVRYVLGTGGRNRVGTSVCHFASGPVPVNGPTDGLGFTGREFVYLVTGLAGYAVCFASALTATFYLVRAGRRGVVRVLRR
jgi:hypothetical protein